MTQAVRDRTRVRFGVFEVDFVAGELRKRGIKIPLQAQPLQILRMMLERPGEVVTRQELRERLWPTDTFVDFEHSVNSSVKKLRQALGDSSDNPRFVETLARRGYRFIASTQDLPIEGTPEVAQFPLVAVRSEEAPAEIPETDNKKPRHIRPALLAVGGIVAAVALLAAGAVGGWWLTSRGGKTGLPSFRRLTFRRGAVLSARFAPDGRTVAYGAAWEGAPAEVFTVRTDDAQSRPIGLSGADVVGVSSKGELAVLVKVNTSGIGMGTLARIPLGGGTPREVLKDVYSADWAPNGEDLAVARRLPNGNTQLEYPIGTPLYEAAGLSYVRVSPKGDLVAFAEWGGAPDSRTTFAEIDRKGKRKALSEGWSGVWGLAWSRRGDEVIFGGGRAINDIAIRAVSLSGRVRVLLASNGGELFLDDVARDGRLLVERDALRSGIACLPRGESREREVGWLDGSWLNDMSEDGSLILFSEEGEASDLKGGVFLRKTDGTPAIRLGDGNPQGLSSDGRWALTKLTGPPDELVLLPTGPGAARKIPVDGVEPLSALLLPSSKGFLIFAKGKGEPGKGEPLALFLVGPDGGKPRPVRTEGILSDMAGIVSPEGDRYVYLAKERRLKIASLTGGEAATVPGAPLNASESLIQWSVDGRFLYILRDEVPAIVDRLELATGRRELWKQLVPEDRAGIKIIKPVRVARDGRSYAYSHFRVIASDLYVVEMPK